MDFMLAARYGTFIEQLRHDIRTQDPCCYQPELAGEAQLLINLAQALLRSVALSSERSGGWAEEGFSSPSQWLAFHTGDSRGRAQQLLRQARHLEKMAHSQAVAHAGLLNETQIRLLTACRAKAEAHYDDHIDEMLVGLDSIDELVTATQAWIAAANAVDSPDPADLALPEPEPSTSPRHSRGAGTSKGTSAPKTGSSSTRSSTRESPATFRPNETATLARRR